MGRKKSCVRCHPALKYSNNSTAQTLRRIVTCSMQQPCEVKRLGNTIVVVHQQAARSHTNEVTMSDVQWQNAISSIALNFTKQHDYSAWDTSPKATIPNLLRGHPRLQFPLPPAAAIRS